VRRDVGYRPGDPSAQVPPAEMPPPVHPMDAETEVINLAEWTDERLMAAAVETLGGTDPFAALLPDPPGVRPERLAYITGQAAKAEAARAAAAAAAAATADDDEEDADKDDDKE
jgi:hypothetical protein